MKVKICERVIEKEDHLYEKRKAVQLEAVIAIIVEACQDLVQDNVCAVREKTRTE